MAALKDLLVSYKQVEEPDEYSAPDILDDKLDRLNFYTKNKNNNPTTSETTDEEQPTPFTWYYSGKPSTSTTMRTVSNPSVKGSEEFEQAYNEVEKEDPEAKGRRAVLTALAKAESGFVKDIQNKAGAPAYGYFQFMQGDYKGRNYNNIGAYAGTDIDTFRGNAKLQIQAANKLAKSFMNSFTQDELNKIHAKGWTDNAIIAGAWLGGPGGVRSYVFNNSDRDDGFVSISQRMKQFNF